MVKMKKMWQFHIRQLMESARLWIQVIVNAGWSTSQNITQNNLWLIGVTKQPAENVQ